MTDSPTPPADDPAAADLDDEVDDSHSNSVDCGETDSGDSHSGDPDAGDVGSDNIDSPDITHEMTDFGPVPVRYRHDGWVPDRQLEFIEALAECGCVDEAARAVGMSRNSAYALRRRHDAQAFRLAWDAAMDIAITRLSDAAMARAIHGVAVPVFHKGEQIGERRTFDERLTVFLLRYRDPLRYGKWLDRMETRQPEDAPAAILSFRIGRMVRAAWRAFDAALRGERGPHPERERRACDRASEDNGCSIIEGPA